MTTLDDLLAVHGDTALEHAVPGRNATREGVGGSNFDETKVKRDGDGQFAKKSAASGLAGGKDADWMKWGNLNGKLQDIAKAAGPAFSEAVKAVLDKYDLKSREDLEGNPKARAEAAKAGVQILNNYAENRGVSPSGQGKIQYRIGNHGKIIAGVVTPKGYVVIPKRSSQTSLRLSGSAPETETSKTTTASPPRTPPRETVEIKVEGRKPAANVQTTAEKILAKRRAGRFKFDPEAASKNSEDWLKKLFHEDSDEGLEHRDALDTLVRENGQRSITFDESKVKRDKMGQFAKKNGLGDMTPEEMDKLWKQHLFNIKIEAAMEAKPLLKKAARELATKYGLPKDVPLESKKAGKFWDENKAMQDEGGAIFTNIMDGILKETGVSPSGTQRLSYQIGPKGKMYSRVIPYNGPMPERSKSDRLTRPNVKKAAAEAVKSSPSSTTSKTGNFRFNPNATLDTSRISDADDPGEPLDIEEQVEDWQELLNHSEPEDDSLEHFGVKGMRWGIRKAEDSGSGSSGINWSTHLSTMSTSEDTNRVRVCLLKGGPKPSTPQEKKELVAAVQKGVAVHVKAMDAGIRSANSGAGRKALDSHPPGPARLKALGKALKDEMDAIDPEYQHDIGFSPQTGDIMVITTHVSNKLKHADDFNADAQVGVVSAIKLTYDDAGNFMNAARTIVPDEDVPEGELVHDDPVDAFLEHFGVKGMRWGIRKSDSSSGSAVSSVPGLSGPGLTAAQIKEHNDRTAHYAKTIRGAKNEAEIEHILDNAHLNGYMEGNIKVDGISVSQDLKKIRYEVKLYSLTPGQPNNSAEDGVKVEHVVKEVARLKPGHGWSHADAEAERRQEFDAHVSQQKALRKARLLGALDGATTALLFTHDDQDTVDAFLEHHGIKGMKWGIRRTDAQLGNGDGGKNGVKSKSGIDRLKSKLRRKKDDDEDSDESKSKSSGSGAKKDDDDGAEEPKLKSLSADHETFLGTMSKSPEEMSTRELQEANNRAQALQNYQRMFQPPDQAGGKSELQQKVDQLNLQKQYNSLQKELTPERVSAVQNLAKKAGQGYDVYQKVDKAVNGDLSKALSRKLGLKPPPTEAEKAKLEADIAKWKNSSTKNTIETNELLRTKSHLLDMKYEDPPSLVPGYSGAGKRSSKGGSRRRMEWEASVAEDKASAARKAGPKSLQDLIRDMEAAKAAKTPAAPKYTPKHKTPTAAEKFRAWSTKPDRGPSLLEQVAEGRHRKR